MANRSGSIFIGLFQVIAQIDRADRTREGGDMLPSLLGVRHTDRNPYLPKDSPLHPRGNSGSYGERSENYWRTSNIPLRGRSSPACAIWLTRSPKCAQQVRLSYAPCSLPVHGPQDSPLVAGIIVCGGVDSMCTNREAARINPNGTRGGPEARLPNNPVYRDADTLYTALRV